MHENDNTASHGSSNQLQTETQTPPTPPTPPISPAPMSQPKFIKKVTFHESCRNYDGMDKWQVALRKVLVAKHIFSNFDLVTALGSCWTSPALSNMPMMKWLVERLLLMYLRLSRGDTVHVVAASGAKREHLAKNQPRGTFAWRVPSNKFATCFQMRFEKQHADLVFGRLKFARSVRDSLFNL